MLDLDKYKYNYVKDKNNVVRRRMLNKVPLIDLVTDSDINLEDCLSSFLIFLYNLLILIMVII